MSKLEREASISRQKYSRQKRRRGKELPANSMVLSKNDKSEGRAHIEKHKKRKIAIYIVILDIWGRV